MSAFEEASKLKLRYTTTFCGVINTEDLWSLSLKALDSIYKELNKAVQESSGKSLFKDNTPKNNLNELRLELVAFVFKYKLNGEREAKNAVIKAERKAKILEIISDKQDDKLKDKSIKELKKELDSL